MSCFFLINTTRRIKCAVLARLLVLEAAKAQFKDLTFVDWVIMQLYRPIDNGSSNDIFEVLTRELYTRCTAQSIDKGIESLDVCLVVDEAQITMHQLVDTFDNDSKTATHPFLFAVIRCLWEIGKRSGHCPILSGTGISVMKMSSVAVSAVAEPVGLERHKSDKYKMQVPISTVLGPQQIVSCVNEMLSSQLLVLFKVNFWSRALVGRPRILWGFLSLAVNGSKDFDTIFDKYCAWITSAKVEGTLANHGGRLMETFPNYEGNELDLIIQMCSNIV